MLTEPMPLSKQHIDLLSTASSLVFRDGLLEVVPKPSPKTWIKIQDVAGPGRVELNGHVLDNVVSANVHTHPWGHTTVELEFQNTGTVWYKENT